MSEHPDRSGERAPFDLSQVHFREGDQEALATHLQGRTPEEIALVQNALQELIASRPGVMDVKMVIVGEDRFIFIRDASFQEITVLVEEIPFTAEREIRGFTLRLIYEPGSGYGYCISVHETGSPLVQVRNILLLNREKAEVKKIYEMACEIAEAGDETKESLVGKIRKAIESLK